MSSEAATSLGLVIQEGPEASALLTHHIPLHPSNEHPGATTWAQVNFTHPGHLSFFIYIVMMQLKPGWSMKGPPVSFRREAPTKAGFSNTPTTSGEQVTFFLG